MGQVAYHVCEPISVLDSARCGARALRLPPHLPDPLQIVAAEILENSLLITEGVSAILGLVMDPGGRYCAATGWRLDNLHETPAATDPKADEQLYRLCMFDLRPGGERFKRESHSPAVEYSRSRGDLILVDTRGVSPNNTFGIQACWSIYYESDVLPNGEASIGGFGTWANGTTGTGGRTVRIDYAPGLSIAFTAPTTGTLRDIRFRVLNLRQKANVQATLYAANGTTILGVGAQELVDFADDYTANIGAAVTASTAYVLKIATDTLDADLDVVANASGYSSLRGTSTLPNLDDWRVEFRYA